MPKQQKVVKQQTATKKGFKCKKGEHMVKRSIDIISPLKKKRFHREAHCASTSWIKFVKALYVTRKEEKSTVKGLLTRLEPVKAAYAAQVKNKVLTDAQIKAITVWVIRSL